jgi:Heterokaryon incompatibility protein (HET)
MMTRKIRLHARKYHYQRRGWGALVLEYSLNTTQRFYNGESNHIRGMSLGTVEALWRWSGLPAGQGQEFRKDNVPPYAILSHTWSIDEVTFEDLIGHTGQRKVGYDKILFCGRQALQDGLQYFWVDTCCIDKRNLPELTRSINSMVSWYQNARKCYAFLSDVSVKNNAFARLHSSHWERSFAESRWFTRGWTLQELIAPSSVQFFSKEAVWLGHKQSLSSQISTITGIPTEALRGRPLENFSIAERMSWASTLKTTEEEDTAYCLLGLFGVFIPLIYGEGKKNAMRRLQREAIEISESGERAFGAGQVFT